MSVKSVKRDVLDVPTDVYVEAMLEQAMRSLYSHGVSVEDYKRYYARQYELDAIQEGRERENQGNLVDINV